MTTKIKGTEGIEFPDSTVQSSAAYTKAESDVPAFSAHLSSPYIPPLNTWHKVPFNTVLFNYGNGFNVANTRFQPPIKGIYNISAKITNADGTQKSLAVYKNGALQGVLANFGANSSTISGSIITELLTTDYVEIYAYMGSTLSVGSETNFQGHLIRRV